MKSHFAYHHEMIHFLLYIHHSDKTPSYISILVDSLYSRSTITISFAAPVTVVDHNVEVESTGADKMVSITLSTLDEAPAVVWIGEHSILYCTVHIGGRHVLRGGRSCYRDRQGSHTRERLSPATNDSVVCVQTLTLVVIPSVHILTFRNARHLNINIPSIRGNPDSVITVQCETSWFAEHVIFTLLHVPPSVSTIQCHAADWKDVSHWLYPSVPWMTSRFVVQLYVDPSYQ